MLYQTMNAIIHKGDRVKKGKEINLSKEEAEALGDSVVPVHSEAVEVEEVSSPVALADMGHDQLKARAKELGLKASGSKADLQERLSLFLEANEEREVTEEDLFANPELVEKGVQVGDTIFLPKEEAEV